MDSWIFELRKKLESEREARLELEEEVGDYM